MTGTISRDCFCKAIRELAGYLKHKAIAEIEVATLLELPACSITSRHTDPMINSVIELLEEAMDDEEHLITDFAYEFPSDSEKFALQIILHCGKEHEIPYKDIGSLYDYLIFRAAQKGDDEESRKARKQLCGCFGINCC